jgi:hypothetical protein
MRRSRGRTFSDGRRTPSAYALEGLILDPGFDLEHPSRPPKQPQPRDEPEEGIAFQEDARLVPVGNTPGEGRLAGSLRTREDEEDAQKLRF